MKKLLSILFLIFIICNICIVGFATDSTNANYEYTITVPAIMTPGETDYVTISGNWDSKYLLTVDVDETVTLTNDIDTNEQKVLDISFDKIEIVGTGENINISADLTVENVDNILFGTWSGVINYNVDMQDLGDKTFVNGLGVIKLNKPANITYNPDTGEVGGIIPPETPENPITTIPAEKLPTIIEFNYGKFETNSTYIPGTYEDVPYERTYVELRLPPAYWEIIWSKWNITKDSNGNILNIAPKDITLADIDTKYANYVVYDFETERYLEMEGVKGDSVELWAVQNENDDTLENAIYLAACIYANTDNENLHIAEWNGSEYIAVDYDEEIYTTEAFFVYRTEIAYKTVEIVAPSTNVEQVYIPVGTLKAEAGMTWKEWLVSEYNTTDYTEPQIKIVITNNDGTVSYKDVTYDDEIIEGANYGFAVCELSGKWKFNEAVILPSEQFNIRIDYNCIYGTLQYLTITNETINYQGSSVYDMSNEHGINGWINDSFRTIDFGDTPQKVSKEFYEWFTSNANPEQAIKFTINGIEYQAESGMTWEQWINSKYHTNENIIIEGGILYVKAFGQAMVYTGSTGGITFSTDTIIADMQYTTNYDTNSNS